MLNKTKRDLWLLSGRADGSGYWILRWLVGEKEYSSLPGVGVRFVALLWVVSRSFGKFRETRTLCRQVMGMGEPQAALQVISHADLCLQERTFGNKTQTFKSVVTVPSARWCPFSGHFERFTNSHGGSLTTPWKAVAAGIDWRRPLCKGARTFSGRKAVEEGGASTPLSRGISVWEWSWALGTGSALPPVGAGGALGCCVYPSRSLGTRLERATVRC